MARSSGLPRTLPSLLLSVSCSIKASEASSAIFSTSRVSPSTSCTVCTLSAVYISRINISPLVKVPVLSVSITVVVPRVSAARRFLTSPPLRIIASIATESTTVTAAGNPSGIAAIATAIESKSISTNKPPLKTPNTNIIATIMPITLTILSDSLLILSFNGVLL